MCSCGTPSSSMHHMTFWTLVDVIRPHTLITRALPRAAIAPPNRRAHKLIAVISVFGDPWNVSVALYLMVRMAVQGRRVEPGRQNPALGTRAVGRFRVEATFAGRSI